MHSLLAVLLDRPGDDLLERREAVSAAASGLEDGPAKAALEDFLGWWESEGPEQIREAYDDAFGDGARSLLNLTWQRFANPRERALALLRLSLLARQAGLEPEAGELPDYLPLLLELAAAAPHVGRPVLCDYLPELGAVLRRLERAESPYAPLLTALIATLAPAARAPALAGTEAP